METVFFQQFGDADRKLGHVGKGLISELMYIGGNMEVIQFEAVHKCLLADGQNTFCKLDLPEMLAVGKCAISNLRCIQFYRPEIVAAGKCVFCNQLSTGQTSLVQSGAGKCAGIDHSYTLRQRHFLQRGAAGKGVFADVLYGSGDGHLQQILTAKERAFLDPLQAIRQHNALQVAVIAEGKGFDYGDAIGHLNGYRIGIGKSIAVNAGTMMRDFDIYFVAVKANQSGVSIVPTPLLREVCPVLPGIGIAAGGALHAIVPGIDRVEP